MKYLNGYIVYDNNGKPLKDSEGYYIFPTREEALCDNSDRENRIKECKIIIRER